MRSKKKKKVNKKRKDLLGMNTMKFPNTFGEEGPSPNKLRKTSTLG